METIALISPRTCSPPPADNEASELKAEVSRLKAQATWCDSPGSAGTTPPPHWLEGWEDGLSV